MCIKEFSCYKKCLELYLFMLVIIYKLCVQICLLWTDKLYTEYFAHPFGIIEAHRANEHYNKQNNLYGRRIKSTKEENKTNKQKRRTKI